MTFSIYFSGNILPGHELQDVAAEFQRRLKLTAEKTDSLFTGARVLLKRNLDQASAEKYVTAMANIGAAVEVSPPLPLSSTPPSEPTLTLEPTTSSEPESVDPYATGNAQPVAQLYCRRCGTGLIATAAHCHRCGSSQQQGTEKNRFVAALLAVFLGWIGAHRLYLGQWWGILYLLIYPIMWLVSLIEAIVFVCTPAVRWNAKYGNVAPGNGLVLAIIGLFGFIFVGGIVAAVSIPAYQDYTIRARVNEGLTWSGKYRDDATDFYLRTGYLPTSAIEIGMDEDITLAAVGSLQLNNAGDLVLKFDTIPAIENESLIWHADIVDGVPQWLCTGGTLPNKFRPAKCRGEQSLTTSESGTSNNSKKLKTYRSDNRQVSLTLRGNWQPLPMDGAALSYLNNRDDIGVAVVVEEREQFETDLTLDEYRELLMEYSFGDTEDLRFEFIEERAINGVPAQIFRVDGVLNGVKVTAVTAAAEAGGNFYKISSWTGTKSYAENAEQMLAAVRSFEVTGMHSAVSPGQR